jgi:hypothetical protein
MEQENKMISSQAFTDYVTGACLAVDAMPDLEIENEDYAKTMLAIIFENKRFEKEIENSRIELVKPLVENQRAINNAMKTYREKIEDLEVKFLSKIQDWMYKFNETAFLPIERIETDKGTLYKKLKWDYFVEDLDCVPREYLMVNEEKVRHAMANGVRGIKGITVMSTEELGIRLKSEKK